MTCAMRENYQRRRASFWNAIKLEKTYTDSATGSNDEEPKNLKAAEAPENEEQKQCKKSDD
ncbi:unnamed protein product [Anisakis simplex]|uniref:Uncharacterized protein n=1 Tax=Anisakis simplex TaxID=6269 RepID=A0A3P6REV6_ANISI|nr:unnamed protein product [Anisakis simplex]